MIADASAPVSFQANIWAHAAWYLTQSVPTSVKAGATFTVAPSTPGTYKMRWRMHRSSPSYTNFFGDFTTEKTITVTP